MGTFTRKRERRWCCFVLDQKWKLRTTCRSVGLSHRMIYGRTTFLQLFLGKLSFHSQSLPRIEVEDAVTQYKRYTTSPLSICWKQFVFNRFHLRLNYFHQLLVFLLVVVVLLLLLCWFFVGFVFLLEIWCWCYVKRMMLLWSALCRYFVVFLLIVGFYFSLDFNWN